MLRGVVGIGDRGLGALRDPLIGTRRALLELPFEAEQVLEEVVAPLRGRRGPGDLETAADGVAALARAVAAPPAQALGLEWRCLRFRADVRRGARSVRLAERMPTGDQRDRLLVVHRHAPERVADVLRGRERVRVAVGALRIDVDEAHLDGRERIGKVPGAAVALVREPRALGAPVHVIGLPHVLAAAPEAEGREAHRLQGAVAREDDQVRPRDPAAVLLLDRPQQPARLVEVHVVRPAVERCEPLLAAGAAAAPVADPVRARAVPGHPDEQAPVVAEVGRPPVLRGRHELEDVALDGLEVELRELVRVGEVLAHRIRQGGVLAELREVELIGPPIPVRRASCSGHRIFPIVVLGSP